jgi:hypothetical protein
MAESIGSTDADGATASSDIDNLHMTADMRFVFFDSNADDLVSR